MSIRPISALLLLAAVAVNARADDSFPPDQVERGGQLYAINCSRCHGFRLNNPGGNTFDLRRFPADQRERFVNSVTKGKGNMPPWGDLFNSEQVEALWAYVRTETKRQHQ